MKRYLKIVGVFLIFYFFCRFSYAASVVIRLTENPTVVGPQISLGDIADIIGPGYGSLERLRRLPVGKAAPAGSSMKLTRDYIKVILRREGFTLGDLSFEGPEMAKALTKSQDFSSANLLPDAKKYILRQLKEAPENVDVKMAGAGKKIKIPAGDIKAIFRPTFSGKYEGTVLLTAELEINGHRSQTLPFRVNVETFHAVVQTTKRVDKGEKFTAENAALVRTPTSKISSGVLRELNNVMGRTASMPLEPGTIIKIDSIYDPPAVSKGRIVQAVVRKGNIELTVDARAAESGKVGDVIRVENTASHKLLRGRVLDEKTVLVEQEKP